MHFFFWLEKRGGERAKLDADECIRCQKRSTVQDLVYSVCTEISDEFLELLTGDLNGTYHAKWGPLWEHCSGDAELEGARADAVSCTLQ
eukprot:2860438-Pyramimonas_sp.AAC.1